MIKLLFNPKSIAYLEFKKQVLECNFPWYWNVESTIDEESIIKVDGHVNIPYYSHVFLQRPEDTANKIPNCNSQHIESASRVFLEILKTNNIEVNSFLRINANCVHPLEKISNSVPHIDHIYEHKNAIIYLTNSGGATIVGNNSHDPKEDDVIMFGGEMHYHQTPTKNRRIVLVATFL